MAVWVKRIVDAVLQKALPRPGVLAAWLGVMPLRQAPSANFYITRLLPLVLCSAGSLFFGNVCYLYLSVSPDRRHATAAHTSAVPALACFCCKS